MKVAVLLKMVLDCGVSLLINEKEMTIEQKDQAPVWIVNPADRAALETALSIKRIFEETEILALNFGQAQGLLAIHYALARGADYGYLIEDNRESKNDAAFAAMAMARLLSQKQIDLVLCGNTTIDHGMSCIGPFIAEYLDAPQITGAVKLDISKKEMKLVVHRRLEKGNREILECALPAVISVDPMIAEPKYVSIYAQILASSRKVESVNLTSLGIGDDIRLQTRVLKINPPRPRVRHILSPDSKLSAEERLKFIMNGGMRPKNDSKLIDGSPESIADQIFKYLQEKGFIT